ncbi:hypothetical protein EDD21DRAFT_391787 [Dissophora ornata]|nr:hypothetical protein EDD21DRAFT_391787 [Dissophora ornata]
MSNHSNDETPQEQTSLNNVSPIRSYPQLPLRSAQQRATQQPSRHIHLPLPEREDSSHPRAITFGTLKKASMANRNSATASSSATVIKKSKMIALPSYFRHTTFKQHFQPEGVALAADRSADSSLTEREPSKRRRLHDNNNRRRHMHFHQASDSSSSSGDSSGDSSSSGSESGNSSYENDSGSNTPKPERRSLRYQLPSRWSSVDKNEKTELSEDDLQVHYTGQSDGDASAIRANRPIPPQCGVYYYEVFVKSKGEKGYIGIGVCHPTVALDRLPGWEPQSWGYHGDDGNSFGGCGSGRPFGPVFTTGDTIGCGVNFRDMSLFYTKNGVYLGVAFRDLKGPLYPTVGMRTSDEIIEANFGQQEFVFNIEDYVKDEKVEAWQTLENTLLKATGEQNQMSTLSQSLSQLVLSYMIHHGYAESAKQFSSDLVPKTLPRQGSSGEGSTSAPAESNQYPPVIVDTERRKVIRTAIMAGEIDKAIELLEKHYPGIMAANEEMVLQLRCRKFVEMVRLASSPLRTLDHQNSGGNKNSHSKHLVQDTEMTCSGSASAVEHMDVDQDSSATRKMDASQQQPDHQEDLEELGVLKDAIQYGRFLQEQYKDNRRLSVQEMLIDAFAVLAYAEAEHVGSGPHPGTKPITREKVASTANAAILASQNLPTKAPLETVFRQTSAVMSELTRLGVGEAAFFDVGKDCME